MLLWTPLVSAQVDPATSEDEIINLSPFEVSTTQGSGYLVTDSNSATKFSVNILDTPFALTTLPKDVLLDSGYQDPLDQLQLSSSASGETNNFAGVNNRPEIRGTQSPRFFVDGMFMNTLFSPDSIAVERIEILKGPSAMLYGQGEPGGTINYTLKRPLTETRGAVGFGIGTQGYMRGEVEWTGPLNDSKSITGLVAYAHTEDDTHMDRFGKEQDAAFARLRWSYDGPQRYVDINHIFGKSTSPTAPMGVFLEDAPNSARTIYRGFTQNGFDAPFDLWGDIYSLNRASNQSFTEVELNATTITWNHRINDMLTINAGFRNDSMKRPNLREPLNILSASPIDRVFVWTNPLDGVVEQFPVAVGDIYSSGYDHVRTDELIGQSYAVNLLFEKDFDAVSIKLNVGADHTEETFDTFRYRSTFSHRYNTGNERSATLAFDNRRPIIHGNIFQPDAGLAFDGPPLSSYVIPDGHFRNNNKGDAVYANAFIQAFNDKLSLAGSIRYDDAELQNNQRLMVSDRWIYGDVFPQSATTYSMGANYKVTETISVFINQAESFRPTVRVGTDERKEPFQFEPTEGEGYDIGVKVALLDNKMTIVASAFETMVTNLPGSDRAQDFDINGNPLFDDNGDPIFFTYSTQDGEQTVNGFEIEGSGQLTENVFLRFGWTHFSKAEVTVNTTSPIQVGQELRKAPENVVVFGVKYQFTDGALDGVAVGLNARFEIDDEIYVSPTTSQILTEADVGPGSPYIGQPNRNYYDGYTNFDVFVSKTFQLSDKTDFKVQLNLFNILDEQYYAQGSYPGRPFSARLSGTLEF